MDNTVFFVVVILLKDPRERQFLMLPSKWGLPLLFVCTNVAWWIPDTTLWSLNLNVVIVTEWSSALLKWVHLSPVVTVFGTADLTEICQKKSVGEQVGSALRLDMDVLFCYGVILVLWRLKLLNQTCTSCISLNMSCTRIFMPGSLLCSTTHNLLKLFKFLRMVTRGTEGQSSWLIPFYSPWVCSASSNCSSRFLLGTCW